MPDVNEILLRVRANTTAAEKSVGDLRRDLEKFPNQKTSEVELKVGKSMAELQALRGELEAIDLKKVHPTVAVEVAKSIAEIGAFEAILASVPDEKNVRMDVKGDLLARLRAIEGGLGRVEQSMGRAGQAAQNAGSSFQSATGGLRSIAPALQGIGLVVIGALIPAFIALAATVLGAGAAIGGLATAFLAALGPVAVIVGAVVSRISAVLGVRKQMQQAAKSETRASAGADNQAAAAAEQRHGQEVALRGALQQRADAEQQLKRARVDAAQAIRTADRDVADAQRAVSDAAQSVRDETVNAYRAMRDAAEGVADAVRDVEHAQLQLQSAQLGVLDAEQNLRDVRAELGLTGKAFDGLFKKFQNVDFNPGKELNRALAGANVNLGTDDQLKLAHAILEVHQARLSEQDATNGVSDAQRALSDARATEAKFARQGIQAYGPLVSAERQAADATRKLADAQATANRLHRQGVNGAPGVVSALRAVRDASQGVAEAQRKLGQPIPSATGAAGAAATAKAAFDKLSKAEQGFLLQLNKTVAFLRGRFKPVTDAAFRGMTVALRALPGLLAVVGPGLGKVAGAMGQGFGQLFATIVLLAPKINTLFGNVAKLISASTPGVSALVTLFVNLANAVMPTAVSLMKSFSGWLQGVAGNAGKLTGKEKFFKVAAASLRQLGRFAAAAGELVVAFIEAVGPSGNKFLAWITKGVKGFAKWMRSAKGQKRIKKFFDDTLPTVKKFVGFLLKLAKNGAKFIEAVSPGLGVIIDGLSGILDFVGWLLDQFLKLPEPVRKWTVALLLAPVVLKSLWSISKKVFGGILKYVKDLVGFPGKIATGFGKVEGAIKKVGGPLLNAGKWLGGKVLDGLKAFWKDESGSVGLGGKIVQKVVGGIKAAGSGLLGAGKWILGRVGDGIRAVIGLFGGDGAGIVTRIVNGIKGIGRGAAGAGKKLIEAGKWLLHRVGDGIRSLIGAFTGHGSSITSRIANGIKGIGRGARATGRLLIGAGRWVLRMIGSGIRGAAKALLGLGRYIIGKVGRGMTTSLPRLAAIAAAGVAAIGAAILIAARGLRKVGHAIGSRVIAGFRAGINDGVRGKKGLYQRIRDVFNHVVQIVKDVFKIQSPSKVMRSLGRRVMDGYMAGLASRPATESFMRRALGGDMIGAIATKLANEAGENAFIFWGQKGDPHGAGALDRSNYAELGRTTTAEKVLKGALKLGGLPGRITSTGQTAAQLVDRLLHRHDYDKLILNAVKHGMPRLASGGLATGPTLAELGEGVHREVVLPLSPRVMGALGSAISATMPTMRPPALAGAGGGFGDTHIHISAPAGEYPDVHSAAAKMAREARRRGGFRR